MKKNIHDLIVQEMLENLKDTWEKYSNSTFFNAITDDDLLEAQGQYIRALRNKKEIVRLQKLIKELS